MKFISVTDYLMGRAKLEDLTDEQVANLNTIVPAANDFLEAFGEFRAVTSGYRTPAINAATPGAAKKSKHMICAAVDLEDADARLYNFARTHLSILEKLGLWCEERRGNWLHLQILPPKSGRRFFLP